MDKTALLHNKSSLPKDIVPFWGVENLGRGEKLHVNLIYKNNIYNMSIERENYKYMRVSIFWESNFAKILSERYPKVYNCLINEQTCDNFPSMRFVKKDFNNYEVEFIDDYNIEDERFNDMYFDKSVKITSQDRRIALEHHGTSCIACGFNFKDVYGDIGEGYIEIHHIKHSFLNDTETNTNTNAFTDLIPLCSNCHSMVHRDLNHILTLDELKEIMR